MGIILIFSFIKKIFKPKSTCKCIRLDGHLEACEECRVKAVKELVGALSKIHLAQINSANEVLNLLKDINKK